MKRAAPKMQSVCSYEIEPRLCKRGGAGAIELTRRPLYPIRRRPESQTRRAPRPMFQLRQVGEMMATLHRGKANHFAGIL